jgi:glycosyltransferase involved in cell wall biosynthesis
MLNMGGVSNFILELGKFLKTNGFDVTIICTDRKGNWYERILQEGLKGTYFDSIFYERIPFGRIIRAWKIGRYMREQAFDFIINNHSFYIHAAAGYFFGGSRIIHVVHNQLEQMVERESDPLADKVVGVSPRIEELALQHLDAQKVTSILNGIKLPSEIPDEYKKCSNRPKDILFVGRIDNRQKAVFLIPEIIQYLVKRGIKTSITMVGDGPDFEELKQRIEERSLSEYFHLTGQVEPEKVSEYYFTHKILLLPSNFEGHPLTLMEAMAHGCVPVASLLPLCTDTCVDQGKSGYLVEVGKVNDFGHGIWDLLSSGKLLNKMSENALGIALDRFSSVHAHQKYLKLLESFEGKEFERTRFPLLNRKYMSWKEMVPFQLVLFIKRKLLEAT